MEMEKFEHTSSWHSNLMAETADKLYRQINLRIINIFMMELSTPALYVYDKYGTAVSEAAIDD
jgi:hypothetical protein